jgi:hypothetical protein
MKTFPKVFQVILDFFFRPMDGGGDLLCRVRPLLQEGADLTPCGFRFLQLSDYGSGIHLVIIARLLSRRISCGEGNPLPVRIPLDCKGNSPSTPYSYHISAHFEGSQGTGSRIEHRVCNFTFLKK